MASSNAVSRVQELRCSLDPDLACSIIASTGLRSLAPFLMRADRRRLRDALSPRELDKYTAWKRSAWYQRRVLRSQLSPRSDDGSRRYGYLAKYLHPIQDQLAHGRPAVLQPGCGSGRWVPFLRKVGRVRYVGFDSSRLLVRYARSTVQSGDAVFLHADMRSFPRFEPVDLILLDYEFLNAFNSSEQHEILRWAYATLKAGGLVLGDVRPSTTRMPSSGSQQWMVGGAAAGPHLFWSEHGTIGRRFFGSQVLDLDLKSMRIVQQRQDLIALLSERQRTALFSSQPWRDVVIDDLRHIPTDKPESASNVRFVLHK